MDLTQAKNETPQLAHTVDGSRHTWIAFDIVPEPTFVYAIVRSPAFAQLRDAAGAGPPKISDVTTQRIETDAGGTGWATSATYDGGWPHQWRERDAIIHGFDPGCETGRFENTGLSNRFEPPGRHNRPAPY